MFCELQRFRSDFATCIKAITHYVFAISQPKESLDSVYFNNITVTTFVSGYRDFPARKNVWLLNCIPGLAFFDSQSPVRVVLVSYTIF